MQNFTIGQEVAILDYKDRLTGYKVYDVGFLFKGRFAKNPAYSQYSRHSGRPEYIADAGGRYVFVQKADNSWTCGTCDGTGYVFNIPRGVDQSEMSEGHRNYYRAACTAWRCINGQRTEPGRGRFILDRKEKVMSLADYAPVLQEKQQASERQRQAADIRRTRIAGRVQEIVDFLPALLASNNKELALANFLAEAGRMGELNESVRNVREKNRPRCTHTGCQKPGETYCEGMCYEHWNAS